MQTQKNKNIIYKILVLLIMIPIISIFTQSLIVRYNYESILPEVISIGNLKKLFTSNYIKLLLSSIAMSIVSAIITIIISIPVANILPNIKMKYRTTLYVVLLAPILVPQFVYFYGMQNVFAKIGIINTCIAVILSHIIVMMPYAIINISNDISLYGKKYEEVAFVMGASDYKLYKDIILPLIKGTLIKTFALLFIISFSQYFITLIIGGGVVKTYATYIFPLILGNDRNFASKASFIYIANVFSDFFTKSSNLALLIICEASAGEHQFGDVFPGII